MPIWDDVISQAKLAQYEKLLHMLEMKDVIDKTKKIHLPMQSLQRESGSVIQQLIWGEMGNFVRKLLWEEQ
jgi:hypothetical protein